MKEITSLTSQRNGDRLNVFLDGKFAFGVEYETAVKFELKVGKRLTDEQIVLLNAEEGKTAAYERALKYAVKKVVTVSQMTDYLRRNGFSPLSVDFALKKLASYGYLDDRAYAASYINTYSKERGCARLKTELKRAGVSDEIIEEALSRVDDGDSCAQCVEKYLRTHKIVERQKLVNYLLYRGFKYDLISRSLSEIKL